MANTNVNKVVFGEETVIDLTEDTVTAETLAEGVTAHDKTETLIMGLMKTGGSKYTVTLKGLANGVYEYYSGQKVGIPTLESYPNGGVSVWAKCLDDTNFDDFSHIIVGSKVYLLFTMPDKDLVFYIYGPGFGN